MRILVCSFGNPGFLFPLIKAANELSARGHTVAFVAPQDTAAPLEASGHLRIARGVRDGPSYAVETWAQPLHVAIDVKHLERAVALFQPDVILTHVLCLAPLIQRARTGVPVAVLGLMSFLWPTADSRESTRFPRTAGTRAWRMSDMLAHLNASRQLFKLPPEEPSLGENPILGDLYLLRSIEALECGAGALPRAVQLVGACEADTPPHDPEAESAIQRDREAIAGAVARGQPVLYAHVGKSFGTPGFWPILREAVGSMPIQVVASIGRMDAPLGELPPNVLVRSHAPQEVFLPFASMVISAGHSTPVLGALTRGVPQVLCPRGGETKDNAERVVAAECGRELSIEDLTPSRLRECIDREVRSPTNERPRTAMRDAFAAAPSFSLLADHVEELGGRPRGAARLQAGEVRPLTLVANLSLPTA